MAYQKTNWEDFPSTNTSIDASKLNKIEEGIANAVEKVSEVNYQDWHSVLLTRSDNDYLYIMLYGSNHLKEGTYSIQNDFTLVTYGTTAGTLTIPLSAIHGISRRDWGFEVVVNRSGITGITSSQYNGIAIPGGATITLQSTQ